MALKCFEEEGTLEYLNKMAIKHFSNYSFGSSQL